MMWLRRDGRVVWLLLWLLLGFAPEAGAQLAPEFVPLGTLPGPVRESAAFGVAADGETVVGACRSAGCLEAWRWTRLEGLSGLGVIPGEATSLAVAASADGAVIVGGSGAKAFRWTALDGLVDLGVAFGGDAASSGVSDDGGTIVGNHFDWQTLQGGSWRWTSGGGAVQLQSFDATLGDVGEFTGISGDGVTVIGYAGLNDDQDPFYWTPSGGFTPLPELPFGECQCGSTPLGISRDGSTIVGVSHGNAFRWSAANGIEALGAAPTTPGQFYEATAVSGDGAVVVGSLTDDAESTAFVWTAASGRIAIADALANLGAAPKGWKLERANGISRDGKVIVGEGVNPSGAREAWMAALPRVATTPGLPALGPAVLGVLAASLAGSGWLTSRRRRRTSALPGVPTAPPAAAAR